VTEISKEIIEKGDTVLRYLICSPVEKLKLNKLNITKVINTSLRAYLDIR
jgi:hypothetical protein